jgi:hypothetical membrane protein
MATKQTRADQGLGAHQLARLALLGIGLYVSVDVLLRFLRPQYSLIYNAESDYGRGPWSWVMDINFLLRCSLSIALVAALHKTLRTSRAVRVGLGLLVAWALGSGILAFFADDVEGTPTHGSGTVHLAVAIVAFIAMAAGGLVISLKLRSDPAWRPAASGLLVVSVLGVVALLVEGRLTGHHAPDGLFERIFLGTELVWMGLVAAIIVRRRRSPEL